MAYDPITAAEIAAGKPVTGASGFAQKVKGNFEYLYSAGITLANISVLNGSFEIDTDEDNIPDNWTKNLYPGGSGGFYTTSPADGAQSWYFTHPGGASNGGGYLDSDYIEISEVREMYLSFILWSTVAGIKNIVQVLYYDKDQSYLSAANIYNSTTNPTSATEEYGIFTPTASARYLKIRLIGGYTDTDVAATTYFDDIRIGLSIVEGSISDAAVAQAKLKTSTGSVNSSTTADLTLPGGTYGFYPQIKTDNGYTWAFSLGGVSGTGIDTAGSYVTNINLELCDTASSAYAQQRYVTSSGEVHWIFVLIDKANGKILSRYQAPDHPRFGNRGIVHPFLNFDPKRHEILVANPSLEIIRNIHKAIDEPDLLKGEKDFFEVFDELYEIDELKEAVWPDIPITIGLPKMHNGEPVGDWRFMPQGTPIKPIKTIIQKPDHINVLSIKAKSKWAKNS